MKILWIFFGGSSHNWASLRSLLCILGSFFRSSLGYFFGVAKIQIFFGVLEIPDIFFLVNGRCWVRAYV